MGVGGFEWNMGRSGVSLKIGKSGLCFRRVRNGGESWVFVGRGGIGEGMGRNVWKRKWMR